MKLSLNNKKTAESINRLQVKDKIWTVTLKKEKVTKEMVRQNNDQMQLTD